MGIFAGKTKKSGGMEVNLGLNTKMDVLLLKRNLVFEGQCSKIDKQFAPPTCKFN